MFQIDAINENNNSDTSGRIQLSVATKLRRSLKLQRFLVEDPSLVHFQMLKNLQSFKDSRLKIVKILWENLTIFWTK